MNFGEAIEALKQGKAVHRLWHSKGSFIVKQVPAHITGEVIPVMQSLPNSAKDILMSREEPHIDYTNQMLIIYPDGHADSWIPSSSDVFAEDWYIYKSNTNECDIRIITEYYTLKNKLKKVIYLLNKENIEDTIGKYEFEFLIKQKEYLTNYINLIESKMKRLGIKVN